MKQSKKGMVDVLIVGAGMAGLTAANELKNAGKDVMLIDKGRGVGGRCATRRIERATFDHGAQFMTAKSSRLLAYMQEWHGKEVVIPWFTSSPGHIRWRGVPAMTGIPKYLAKDLDIKLRTRAVKVEKDTVGWIIQLENQETIGAHCVLLTPPLPQSLESH